MTFVNIRNIKTNYIQTGQGNDVICLVGWGQDTRMFEPTLNFLSSHFRVTCVDYPGFGLSDMMSQAWSMDDYVLWFEEFVRVLGINEPIIIAHSFGARIALKYNLRNPIRKLVFTGAAGIKPKRKLSVVLRIRLYKLLKKLVQLPGLKNYQEKLKKTFGSEDYRAISGVLRDSFVRIVNEDLSPYLSKIEVPCLLIWGDKDDATPLWMGQKMEKEMQDAGLVIFENEGHYAYWNQIHRFNKIVDVFLEKDRNHE
jgi:pimeloyl-ACP methyl ester carboxylesterase